MDEFTRLNSRNPKFKIEFTNNNGAKYSFAVQGSKEDIRKLMDLVETLSEKSIGNDTIQNQESTTLIDTNFNRVYELIESKFQFSAFGSADVLRAYESEFGIHTTLSTISTYLARLADRGFLNRSRSGAGWIYRLPRPQNEELNPATKFISR
ncbi:MAG: hypothetical protein ACYCQJ_01645 [Nitrososphaerales archaeon]